MSDAVLRGFAAVNSHAPDDDLLLVRRLAAGDRSAMEEIHALHARALGRYIRHVCPDPGLGEEVLQETLVAAWQGAARFAGRSSLRTWLIGIARRQALTAVRKKRLPRAPAAELNALPAPDPEPEAAVLAGAEREEVAAALRRLSPLHREALVLTFVHGLSYPELAACLGVPLGTVKSRLSNARAAMRAALQSRGGERE